MHRNLMRIVLVFKEPMKKRKLGKNIDGKRRERKTKKRKKEEWQYTESNYVINTNAVFLKLPDLAINSKHQ